MKIEIQIPTLTTPQKVFLVVSGILTLIFILLLAGVFPGARNKGEVTTIDFWGVDGSSSWSTAISKYQKENPSIKISYRSINQPEYEKTLIDALAAGRGPDIFMVDNNWLLEHGNKMKFAPSDVIAVEEFSELYFKSAQQDFTLSNNVYALPVNMDTLALIYNRDLLDKSGILSPPRSWDDLDNVIEQITVFNGEKMVRGAISLGYTDDITLNGPDVLGLLFQQNDIPITNNTYTKSTVNTTKSRELIQKYVSYGSAGTDRHAYSTSLGSSLEAFAEGKLALQPLYYYQLSELDELRPDFEYAVSEMLQEDPNSSINYPDYQGIAVALTSDQPDIAWDFVFNTATDPDIMESYTGRANRLPALKELSNKYTDLKGTSIYIKQALSARSSLRPGEDVETIFNDAIGEYVIEPSNIRSILSGVQDQITDLLPFND